MSGMVVVTSLVERHYEIGGHVMAGDRAGCSADDREVMASPDEAHVIVHQEHMQPASHEQATCREPGFLRALTGLTADEEREHVLGHSSTSTLSTTDPPEGAARGCILKGSGRRMPRNARANGSASAEGMGGGDTSTFKKLITPNWWEDRYLRTVPG